MSEWAPQYCPGVARTWGNSRLSKQGDLIFTVACVKEQCSAAAGDSVIMLDGLLL